jgi:riboflavin kinase/FMN adenylyltransferase
MEIDLKLAAQDAIEVIEDWRDFPARLRGGCVSIGNFDGVHRGHQILLQQASTWAWQRGRPSIVFTFSPHPLAILQPELAPLPLTTVGQRGRRLALAGIDVMVVCQVDQALLDWDYRHFFDRVVVQTLAAKNVVEGPNFFFGKDRQGDVAKLQELCRRYHIDSHIVVPEEIEGRMISSSRIRHWLKSGDVGQANLALGYRYQISGRVVAGEGRGRHLGFPTANLADITNLLPRDGVYAAWTRIDGHDFPVALQIGSPLTFPGSPSRVEAHILGLSQDLYGRVLHLDLGVRLRDVTRFDSGEQLKRQIAADVMATWDWARQSLSSVA